MTITIVIAGIHELKSTIYIPDVCIPPCITNVLGLQTGFDVIKQGLVALSIHFTGDINMHI